MPETQPSPAPRPETLRELGFLFRFLRPYRAAFMRAVVASMVSMGFGTMFPWLLGYLIDAAVPARDRSLAWQSWTPTLDQIALMLIGTLIAQAALTFFSSQAFNKAGESAVVDLR